MSNKLKPIGDRVLIRQAESEKKIGKIHLPTDAQKKPARGTVIAVGNPAGPVKVNDVVWFDRYQAVDVEGVGSEKYLLLKHEHLLAVEEK